MKIIFITREGYGLSGARVRCYNFARALGHLGIETEVFSFADDLGARYGEKELEMSCSDKIRYNTRAFKALLRKDKDAVFFMQRLNYHTLAPFLLSLSRKNRFIFDCDDWNIRENPVYHLGLFPSSKMEYLTRKIAGYSSICIAASAFLKDYLSRFNDKVYYIPTGVDAEVFRPRNGYDSNSKITFSWIGTVYHREMQENVRFIIDCFLELADKHSNVFLELAGEGRYFQELKTYPDNFKYKDRVIIRDWIQPDKIPDYLSRIDIGLLPLVHDTRFNRAKSPTKLFEYMAMARPTVSSNIGEPARIIEDGKDGFLAGSKEKFIEDMERLIEEPLLRKDMGDRARETVEAKHSLDVLGRRLCEILKTV